MRYFTPDLFTFLKDLKAHNDRPWFESNKPRYEANVKEPMLRFITDLGPRLKKISPHLTADPRPSGGSMFRIYRDIRFSRDKTPYKTNVGAYFHHARAKDVHAPGMYLHLAPRRSFGGGGLWEPDAESLKSVRDRIVARPKEWKAAKRPGLDVEGDTLKRVPAGYDPAHTFAEDFKLKSFYISNEFTEREVCA
ncbi:MAG: DUF2461 domain-containing protein, partial [Thermodesulfobacteriota bacterium]